jgi:hypothetical protein
LVNGGLVEEEFELGVGDALGVKLRGTDVVLIGTIIDEFKVGKKLPLLEVDEIVSE